MKDSKGSFSVEGASVNNEMTVDEAIQVLRADPRSKQLIEDSYLSPDVGKESERFFQSAEFEEVRKLVGAVEGRSVLDLGAGTGFASWAFSTAGAARVYALEPDPSLHVGQGAIVRVLEGTSVRILASSGEHIPLEDGTVDIVFTRQVLHHVRDLERVLAECVRVLRRGGVLLATREHVVNDEEELVRFLAGHPIHNLAGGENAYLLNKYTDAITSAGLRLEKVLGPWDSLINAYPTVRSTKELSNYARVVLEQRFGPVVGKLAARIPGMTKMVRWSMTKRVPGRMYSFLAVKP